MKNEESTKVYICQIEFNIYGNYEIKIANNTSLCFDKCVIHH